MLLLSLAGASVKAQVGYYEVSLNTAPGNTPFTVLSNDKVFVIPFSMYSPGSGTYTLNTLFLDLRFAAFGYGDLPVDQGPDPRGDPLDGHPGDAGSGNSGDQPTLSKLSLQVFATRPTSLPLPTPLLSFLSGMPSQSPYIDALVFPFSADSAPSLTAGATYYLAVGYTSVADRMEWDQTTGASYGYDYPGDNPVTDLVSNGTPLVYYEITSGGVQNFYDNVGGFAIMASRVTAIPEPASAGVIVGSSVLALGLALSRRRRRSALLHQNSIKR